METTKEKEVRIPMRNYLNREGTLVMISSEVMAYKNQGLELVLDMEGVSDLSLKDTTNILYAVAGHHSMYNGLKVINIEKQPRAFLQGTYLKSNMEN